MGMNYYTNDDVTCDHCGVDHDCPQGIHLGKSSYGWQFTFAWNGGEYYKSVDEMREWTKDRQIYNEENETVSYKEFWQMIESKMKDKSHIDYNREEEKPDDDYGVIVDGIYFMEGWFS